MSLTKPTISIAELKARLIYSPNTGNFFHKKLKRNVGHTWKSHNTTYRVINLSPYGPLFAHRLAFLYMTGSIPVEVDHKDQNGLNNKWDNLVKSNHSHNGKNTKLRKGNKYGIHGITRNKPNTKWQVTIMTDGKTKRLGTYKNFFEACCVRKSAENKYGFSKNHGKY